MRQHLLRGIFTVEIALLLTVMVQDFALHRHRIDLARDWDLPFITVIVLGRSGAGLFSLGRASPNPERRWRMALQAMRSGFLALVALVFAVLF